MGGGLFTRLKRALLGGGGEGKADEETDKETDEAAGSKA